MRKLLLLFFIFVFNQSIATHVIGGDISYKFLSKDTIEVYYNLYKDCKGVNSVTPMIKVTNSPQIGNLCTFSKYYNLTLVSCKDITNVCSTSCSKCDKSTCNGNGYPNGLNPSCSFPLGLEKLVYKATIVFDSTYSSSCCTYRFSIKQGARTNSITTCCSGENFYIYADVNRCDTNNKSQIIFKDNPLYSYCVKQSTNLSFKVIGTLKSDSFSYHLVPALSDSGIYCNYIGQYKFNRPLYFNGFPNYKKDTSDRGFQLDSLTGILDFLPLQQQSATIVAEVKLWRFDSTANRMRIIGVTRRDMSYVFVGNCSNNSPKIMSNQDISICGDTSFCFLNNTIIDINSKDSVFVYAEDFSDTNVTIDSYFDTSKNNNAGKIQVWKLCSKFSMSDTLKKLSSFKLIAKDNSCPLPGYTQKYFNVKFYKKPKSAYSISVINCNKIIFKAWPLNINKLTDNFVFDWDIGRIGNKHLISGDSFYLNIKDTGYIPFTLKVSNNGCFQYFIDSFLISNYILLNNKIQYSTCPNKNIIINNLVNFSTHYPLKYEWITGLSKDTLDSLSINPQSSYFQKFKISNSSNCIILDSVYIQVFPSPVTGFNKKIYKCPNERLSLGVPGYFSYKWNTGSTNNNIEIDTSGLYWLIVTNKFGCIVTDSVEVKVYPQNHVFIGNDTTICEGSFLKLSDTIFKFRRWYDNSTGVVFYAKSPGNYHIEAIDSNQCIWTDTINIKSFPYVLPKLTKKTNKCPEDSVELNAGIYKSYNWSNGDQSKSIYVKTPKIYTLLVTDTFGCVFKDTAQVSNYTINPFKIGNDTNYICPGQFVIFDGGKRAGLQWSTGAISQTVGVSEEKQISAIRTDSNGCKAFDTAMVIVTPNSGFTYKYISPKEYQFTPFKNYYHSYQWNFGDNTQSNNSSPKHFYQFEGKYSVKLTVTDTNGCSNDSVLELNINTGIKPILSDYLISINHGPNPFQEKSFLTYTLKKEAQTFIKLYDMIGKEISIIHQGNQLPGVYQFEINSNLQSGNYILSININNNHIIYKIQKL